MENIPVLYLLFVLTGCLLALMAIWSRRNMLVRVVAVITLVALVGLNYSALINLLGLPKPMQYSRFEDFEKESTVLAASIDEGLGIYLWLRHPEVREPRYYKMEWDQEAAIDLKRAMDQSMRNHSTVMMSPDYENSLETNKEPLFYTLPQDRLPLKPPQELFEYRNPRNPI
jgi:hypothetical protein